MASAPIERKVFICKEAQHNKIWEYKIEGLKVTISWGRVGGSMATKIETFASRAELDEFVAKKVKDKTRARKEGQYNESNGLELQQEKEVAQALGHQHKIRRVEWVDLKQGKDGLPGSLRILNNYDPKRWVYAEVLNSWSKDVTHIVLNKEQAFEIRAMAEEKGSGKIQFDRMDTPQSNFVEGIRLAIRKMAQAVVAAIRTFADVGGRSLDGEVDAPSKAFDSLSYANSTGTSLQVINKFAGLGSRTLDLDL